MTCSVIVSLLTYSHPPYPSNRLLKKSTKRGFQQHCSRRDGLSRILMGRTSMLSNGNSGLVMRHLWPSPALYQSTVASVKAEQNITFIPTSTEGSERLCG